MLNTSDKECSISIKVKALKLPKLPDLNTESQTLNDLKSNTGRLDGLEYPVLLLIIFQINPIFISFSSVMPGPSLHDL